MKRTVKILSVFCCVLLVSVPFSLTAFAENSNIVFDFVLLLAEKLVEQNFQMSDDANSLSPSEFRDKYSENKSYYDYMAQLDGNGGVDAALATMSNADYLCATVNKSMLDKLKNSANSFLSDYYKDLRINTFEDFNLQTYDKVESQSGTWLGLKGSGSFVHYGTTYDGAYYELFNEPSKSIALYTGSNQAPWCIYTSEGSSLYQNGKNITNGSKCFVLPLDYNTVVVFTRSSSNYLKFRWTSGSTINDVNFFAEGSTFFSNCFIYRDGERLCHLDNLGDVMSRYDFVSKLTNMINVRLTVNENDVPHANINLPSDIPYDNNNEVVVCVPVGGGDIIYYTPQTFNNYIDNGDIVYNNENYDNSRVESVVNNYNNYITNNNTTVNSTYDDSNLLSKLQSWFSDVTTRLDTIIDNLKPSTVVNNFYNTYINVEPCYENFSDCFYDNIPAAAEAKALFDDLGNSTKSIDPVTGDVTDNSEELSYTISLYNPFNDNDIEMKIIDFEWYEPYRNDIRDILKIGAYVMGFIAIWSAIKSVFGVHNSGGDG